MADVQLALLGNVIKDAYEGEPNTNAFTDAEKTKLTSIEHSADVTDAVNVASAGAFMITTNNSDSITQGVTKLFMTAAERTKLSGIEAGATANPNAIDDLVEDLTPQLGGDLDGQGFGISNFKAVYNNQTGTTYTLLLSDRGKIITLNNSSAITVTLPNNLPIGWSATFIQLGTGLVTFSAASNATLNHRQAHTKIAGRYGMASLTVYANSDGTHAIYALCGDTSA